MQSSNKTAILVALITLAGGITTALIANWDKIFKKKDKTIIASSSFKQTASSEQEANTGTIKYTGNVGKWPTIYELTWNSDGTIDGKYEYYQRNTSDKYELKGRKINESSIELHEYINGLESATALLVLKDNCYSGKIKNKDYVNSGKMFDMTICK